MEGEVSAPSFGAMSLVAAFSAMALLGGASVQAQETAPANNQGEISLRKSINTRKVQGQDVEGEDRVIGKGDTLWRILVEEKGLPGQKFQSYVVVIRGLNPQLKNIEVLRIGDKIFIPLRPDETLKARSAAEIAATPRPAPGSGVTIDYQVKPGEYLYQILRAQLKLADERKLAQYYALVKDLNPERKNWDTLVGGEVIRLPTVGPIRESAPAAPSVASATKTPAPNAPVTVESKSPSTSSAASADKSARPLPPTSQTVLRAPAKDNLSLFAKVAEAIGGEFQQNGEEVISLKDESVRLDKSMYPVIFSPALHQRIVLDPDNSIPGSLKAKLGDPTIRTPVLPLAKEVSVREAVGQLLAGLGYQPLPGDRPVVIQDQGIAYEAKGDWMALGPEENNKTQEVFIINLTDQANPLPEYLASQLAKSGLRLRNVSLSAADTPAISTSRPVGSSASSAIKTWPKGKAEIIDALLLAYGVPFGVAETFSIELRDGLRVDMRTDRLLDVGGKRTALFFRPGDGELRKALEERQDVRTVELNIAALSSREIIAKILSVLGDPALYREHRFAAGSGAPDDRLTVKAWGFQLAKRPLFITDREIPSALDRFFFEKGLEIIYFQ